MHFVAYITSILIVADKTDEKSASAKTITIKSANSAESSPTRVEADSTTGEKAAASGLEDAATKIQAAFRGHQTRKSMKQADKPSVSEPEPEPSQEQLEAEFRADDKGTCYK